MAYASDFLTTSSGSAGEFIPELWSDDIVAAYKSNLVIAALVSKINHVGKKGDTIHIPSPSRGSATAKTVGNEVTLQNPTTAEITVTINKWFEYSTMIEDLINIQSLSSMRRHITDAAGYALAKKIDQDIHILGALSQGSSQYDTAVIGGDGSTVWDGTANTNTGNASTLTDAGIREMIQTLDDADVPFNQRYLIIPPVEKNSLMGLSRFTEQAFVGEQGMGNTIRNGKLGDLYGVEIFVSTNCPYVQVDTGDGDDFFSFSSAAATTGTDATGESVTIGGTGTTRARVGLMLHKDAFVLAEQLKIRSQSDYMVNRLGSILVSDTIYGTAELRNDASVAFIVPS